MTDLKAAVLWFVYVVLASINPWAAIGAAFGCCFFLAVSPSSTTWQRRMGLAAFSWAIGCGAGVYWYGEGPPYSQKAMLVASSCAALAVVTFTSFYYIIDKRGELPEWLESILDRIPALRRRGGNDGA